MTGTSPHVVVLPGGGYAAHSSHEGEPIARWLSELGVAASVFVYPLEVRHPAPVNALRAEIVRLKRHSRTLGHRSSVHLFLAAVQSGARRDPLVAYRMSSPT